MMKSYKLVAIGLGVLLCGCVSQNEVQHTWVRASLNNEQNERIVADSTCLAESYKAVPEAMASYCGERRGFARGSCEGSNSRRVKDASALRMKIYDGCMLGKGWKKQPIS